MNAGAGVVRNRRETNAVSRGMTEFFAETALAENFTCRMVNITCLHAGANGRERCLPRIEHTAVDALLLFINPRQRIGARDVAPIAIGVGIAMHENQIGPGDPAIARARVRAVRFRRVGPRHAESESVGALAAVLSRTLEAKIHAKNPSHLDLAHSGL